MSTSTWPSRGTSVFTAASTENVPLPCTGTQTCVSDALRMPVKRSRTRAVTALNLLSHEPQSCSMAVLVASEVVSGPGVSRIGSRSVEFIGVNEAQKSRRRKRPAPGLRAREEPARDAGVDQADDRRGRDDQRAHRRGRSDLARFVEIDDRYRSELGVG